LTVVSKGLFVSKQGKPGEMEIAVKDAIDIGYRHFDSAMIYSNEHEVGAAVRAKIADGTVKREDLFITNKVNRKHHNRSSSLLVPGGRS
jgi:diketogulonate reductase-like aldo/keto reductase